MVYIKEQKMKLIHKNTELLDESYFCLLDALSKQPSDDLSTCLIFEMLKIISYYSKLATAGAILNGRHTFSANNGIIHFFTLVSLLFFVIKL